MPIIDGMIVSTSQTSGAERSLRAAALKYGVPFWFAFERAMTLDMNDPMNQQIFADLMTDDDPGEFLMNVFGNHAPAADALDIAVAKARELGEAGGA